MEGCALPVAPIMTTAPVRMVWVILFFFIALFFWRFLKWFEHEGDGRRISLVTGWAGGGLLRDVGDHFVYDQPFAVELVERQELGIVEVIHFDLDPGYGDGIGDLDALDLSVERFSGVFWALAIFDAIQVLGQCFVIGLSFDVAEEQGA